MELSIATNRVRRILDHVAAGDEIPPSSSHLFAMNCSSTLNSSVRRYDNRTIFARQGFVSNAGFMQQASTKQSHGCSDSASKNVASNCSAGSGDSSYQNQGEPLFSRKAQVNFDLPDLGDGRLLKQDCALYSTEAPNFSSANSGKIHQQPLSTRTTQPSLFDGLVWSPRIDIAESYSGYAVTVELPGVSINGISVVVDDQNLTIAGKRIIRQWGLPNFSADSDLIYHRKEILQGPYQVLWPLPKDVNKDCISAEYVDGFLRIMIPKILNA
ncbi:17.6 kDa class I heat shock protein 1 [Apostasia shenzhenica]|uniref:17.6 kDa class I heat shock protein 1 n=1 Tax=Apostasia shenzhenica TaxID=1088818 RepID=A0A2I0B9J6_9ASPA|nr:17.6 kDa class I heat shock protein 1 [Apostasia shenzhenica]